MRKTKLVILPGVRTLNRIGCLLLFLACPTIAFKGQENRDVEPISKLLALNEIWFATEPEKGEKCVEGEEKAVSDDNAMLESGKSTIIEKKMVTREITRQSLKGSRDTERTRDALATERRVLEGSRRLATDRRHMARIDRRERLEMDRRLTMTRRSGERSVDSRMRVGESRVVSNVQERKGIRLGRVARDERGERRREGGIRRSSERRERVSQRVDERQTRGGTERSRDSDSRRESRRFVREWREREIAEATRQMTVRRARDTRSVNADRRSEIREREDRRSQRQTRDNAPREVDTRRDDRRSRLSEQRRALTRREMPDRRDSSDYSRRQTDVRRVNAERRVDLVRSHRRQSDARSRKSVESSFARSRRTDENNNQKRPVPNLERVASVAKIDSKPPTDASIMSNEIPKTGFKEMTAWLWKDKDFSGWLGKINYGSVITTGFTCLALYMSTNRKTASY